MLTLQKLQTGGKQVVQVQHVNVGSGGQAVVAGEIKSKAGQPEGAEVKSGGRPYTPTGNLAYFTPRLRPGAALDAGGPSCPARHRRCGGDRFASRMVGRAALHGANGAYHTGRYTAEAKAERQQKRDLIRDLRRLIDSAD
jgi:hypothetical protein